MTGQTEFDLLLLFVGYFIAILSRFRVLIYILQTVVFLIRLYEWILKNQVDIDEHIQRYVHHLRDAEEMIFPALFRPFIKNKHKRKGLNAS